MEKWVYKPQVILLSSETNAGAYNIVIRKLNNGGGNGGSGHRIELKTLLGIQSFIDG